MQNYQELITNIMKAFILYCLISLAVASDECGENQHYSSCGTPCPLTCENYRNPPKFCILRCDMGCECDKGFVKTKDGRCVKPEDCPSQSVLNEPKDELCALPVETGPCRGFFPRYYFDKGTGECKKFIYGGCRGNANNFKTIEECHDVCA